MQTRSGAERRRVIGVLAAVGLAIGCGKSTTAPDTSGNNGGNGGSGGSDLYAPDKPSETATMVAGQIASAGVT